MRMVSRLIASQLRVKPLRVRVPLLPLSTWSASGQMDKASCNGGASGSIPQR